MQRAFQIEGITIDSVRFMSDKLLRQSLSIHPTVDAMVTVKPRKNEYYYSDMFISFNNVAISRTMDNVVIDTPIDLADQYVLAFSGASKYLDKDYVSIFSDNRNTNSYREYKFPQQQVESFLNGEGDVVIIDKNMFSWHSKNMGYIDQTAFKKHHIFPTVNSLSVGFRDKYFRDKFNAGLSALKQRGEYQYIIDQYTNDLVQSKTKFMQLISAIVANYMFDADSTPLKSFLSQLNKLPYVQGIEIYDNDNTLLSSAFNTDSEIGFFRQYDIINLFNKTSAPQGYLRVYFDEQHIESSLQNSSLIPDLQFFKTMSKFNYISAIYRRLNYQDNAIIFTTQERRYLDSNPVLSFSEVTWRPLSIVEGNQFSGLMADYMDIISTKTGIEFTLIKENSWPDVIKAFEEKRIDLIPGITDIEQHASTGLISNEFSFFNFAIVMGEKASFVDTLSDLTEKSIALPKGDPVYHFIKQKYPAAKIIETDSMEHALELVSQTKADAYIGHMAVAIHQLETRYPQLKIVGQLNAGFSHRILVHDNQAILLSIINKVLASIDDATHREIRQRWVKRSIKTAVDYTVVFLMLLALFIISLIFIYSFRRVSTANKQVARANQELSSSIAALEEQKSIFETLFYETTDGQLLIKDGIYFDCNSAALLMMGYQNKQQLIGKRPVEISPEYQPNGVVSKEQAAINFQNCVKNGSNRFEWVLNNSSDKQFWVEIVLTEIVLNNEQLIHVVWRDIQEKKQLEQAQINHSVQLQAANSDLELSLNNLKNAQQQLIESEKMASLGGLVAGVAHEINTPVGIGLTAITHFLELNEKIDNKYAQQRMKKSDFDNYLSASKEIGLLLYRNLERTADLVSSFKQVSVDQTSDQLRTFNIAHYIDEILRSIHHIFKNTGIEISLSCSDDLTINGSPGALSQIISNIVINASIHAFPNKTGHVNISIDHHNDSLHLIISDDGIGINQHNISKIFEPFYTTNRDNGGSGLGLNIVYNIVTNQLNGTINCISEVNQGTTFDIAFPVELA